MLEEGKRKMEELGDVETGVKIEISNSKTLLYCFLLFIYN
jgi:hypothetical protein